MDHVEAVKKLIELDEALFPESEDANALNMHRPRRTILSSGPPFDISRPNIHDSKAEFLREREAVEAAIESCDRLTHLLLGNEQEDAPEHIKMTERLMQATDAIALRNLENNPPSTVLGLIRKNAVDSGLSRSFVMLTLSMQASLSQRLTELNDQELQFWNVSNRPPNYFARAIALRFARHFARHRQTRPTFGNERGGNEPSTDYGRALAEIFEILEIKASVKNAARWALEQLKDEDWKPSRRGLLNTFLGDYTTDRTNPDPKTNFLRVIDALEKSKGK